MGIDATEAGEQAQGRRVRARGVILRFSFSTVIAGAGVVALSDIRWPVVWYAGALVLQAAILAIGAPVSPWRKRALDLVMLLSAYMFAAWSVMFWFLGGPAARQFALFLLVGQ